MNRRAWVFLLAAVSFAAGQGEPGAGNAEALKIARGSKVVQRAMQEIRAGARAIQNSTLRAATIEALGDAACVAHRAGLSEAVKKEIVAQLVAGELVEPGDGDKIQGGLMAGVFPPLVEDARCPKLPQGVESAPGSSFGGHHSYPGGLPIHEAFNLQSARNFGDLYREWYGPNLPIDRDLIVGPPLWHDWAKALVYQWNADGTEFAELHFGGCAKNDSRTPAHHILGLAETMARGFPADFIIAQASAHAAPVLGNEWKVVNWLRAAAMIARVNPVERGFLAADGKHIARFRPEDSIHNLSDADFVLSVPAMSTADRVIEKLAAEFGFEAAKAERYNFGYRNVVLSKVTAERILFLYSASGMEAVRAEVRRAMADAPRR